MKLKIEQWDCIECGTIINKKKNVSFRRKTCSKDCYMSFRAKRVAAGVRTPEARRKQSVNHSGSRNYNWSEKPSYSALHKRMYKIMKKPEACEECGEKKRLDLANISQKYLFDITDWTWLCRRCHLIQDGRLAVLIKRSYAERYKRKHDLLSEALRT